MRESPSTERGKAPAISDKSNPSRTALRRNAGHKAYHRQFVTRATNTGKRPEWIQSGIGVSAASRETAKRPGSSEKLSLCKSINQMESWT